MKQPLRVLIVEDNDADVQLLLANLRAAGFQPEWSRVETDREFRAEIAKQPDLILSDYSMPEFDGLRAAQILQASGRDIPFILISGTLGEEIAVTAMRHGVTDYLLKDRTARLGEAVAQALTQKRLRQEQKKTEAALRLFRTLIDQSSDGIEVIDPETGQFLDVNETNCRRLGYRREELLTMRVQVIEAEPLDSEAWRKNVAEIRTRDFKVIQIRQKRKDGTTFPVEIYARFLKLDREYLLASVRDITERRKAELESESQLAELKRWHEVLLGREDRVLELKQEVNELLARLHEPGRYSIQPTA